MSAACVATLVAWRVVAVSLQSRMPRATCIVVLVWLSFAAMASPALAQDPLPIPGNLGATYSMPTEPRASTSIRHRIPPTAAGAPGGTSRSLARACISRCLFRTSAPAEVLASPPRDWGPRRARLSSFPVVLAHDETRAIVFDGRRRRGSGACGLRYPSRCLLDVCIVLNSSLLTGKPVDACIDRRVEVMR